MLHPTERHEQLLGRLLIAAGSGNLTTDAHLAALAIEHGATLASFDRDFERFNGLDFERLHALALGHVRPEPALRSCGGPGV